MLQISAGQRMAAKDAVDLLLTQALALPDDLDDSEGRQYDLARSSESSLRDVLQRAL
jgi:hypothetical protein